MEYCLVYFTAKNADEAAVICKELVEKRIVACANIIPRINSIYRWQGEMQNEEEALVFMKTEMRLSQKVVDEIKKLHSYQVPAISVINIEDGSEEFFRWVSTEISEE